MSKEMIVSCSSHETKIAILEDDQVSEVYFERGKEYTLAGSIYKGRVTRVLPGMQSAFVDIGLERDAFLYVSDFLEDQEEYDKIASTVEEKVIRMEETAPATEATAAPAPIMEPSPAEAVTASEKEPTAATPSGSAPETVTQEKSVQTGSRSAGPFEPHQRYGRRRRRRGHHKGFPESKYASRQPAPPAPATAAPAPPPAAEAPMILPGESLAKYKERTAPEAAQPQTEEPKREPEQPTPEFTSASSGETANEAAGAESAREERRQPLSPQDSAEAAATEVPIAEQVERDPKTWETVSRQVALAEEAAEEQIKLQEQVKELTAEQQIEDRPSAEERITPPKALPEPPVATAPSLAVAEVAPLAAEFAPETFSDVSTEAVEAAQAAEAQAVAGLGETAATAAADVSEGGEAQVAPERTGPTAEAAAVEQNGPASEGGMPQHAAVRERHRNPRYTRKTRWMARKEGRPEGAGRGGRPRERESAAPLIADLLKEGQEILVQIAKEPLGKKGARITSHIALPGRYLVYMPTVDHIGVSRKIASDEERQRLKRIILEHGKGIPGGFIVRTAGEGHSGEDFRQDIQYLWKLWAEIRAQAEKASAPALLHHDLNLVLRILRDQFSEEFSAVWVDHEQEYEEILGLVSKFQPGLVNRVKMYTKDVPIFDELAIQEEINKALKPKVWLKSGGYIVINQTEALVAIDVNTGKFVGKSNRLEDTIVKTNVEAIQEIVRQIRLRDLGGIIVIDFIDMDEKKNRQKVMAAMEEALKNDRSPSKILAFNEFGLVAITRKRVRQSLERTLCQPCVYCTGSGLVKSVQTVCYEILSEAKKIASQLERKQITLRVNPEVGRALKSRDNTILQEIEEMTAKPVVIRNDPMLHVEHFDFN